MAGWAATSERYHGCSATGRGLRWPPSARRTRVLLRSSILATHGANSDTDPPPGAEAYRPHEVVPKAAPLGWRPGSPPDGELERRTVTDHLRGEPPWATKPD